MPMVKLLPNVAWPFGVFIGIDIFFLGTYEGHGSGHNMEMSGGRCALAKSIRINACACTVSVAGATQT
jgi:hypothetical protein